MQRDQAVSRHRQLADLVHARRREAVPGGSLGHAVAQVSRAIGAINVEEIDAPDYLAARFGQHMEQVHASGLLRQQFLMPRREMREVRVAAVGNARREVRPVLDLEGKQGRSMIGTDELKLGCRRHGHSTIPNRRLAAGSRCVSSVSSGSSSTRRATGPA